MLQASSAQDPRWEQGLESKELFPPKEDAPELKYSDSTGAPLRDPPETLIPWKEGYLEFMV